MMRRLNHFTDLGAFWGSKPERFLEELQVQNHKPTDSTGKPQTTLEEGQKKSTETPPPTSLKTKDMERTKKRPPVSPSQSDPKENFLEQIQRGVPLKKVKVEETPKKPSDSTAFKNMITTECLILVLVLMLIGVIN